MSGCPVDHSIQSSNSNIERSHTNHWWHSTFGLKSPSPVDKAAAAASSEALFSSSSSTILQGSLSSGLNESSCPVVAKSDGSVASLEEAAKYAQTPQAGQKLALGTVRQVSSIPRGDTQQIAPHHQEGAINQNNWVYPSEQQLYNAMRRKGWQNIPEDTVPMVLNIHNHINERTWRQIQEWEGTNNIRLGRFQGRPRDITPKAFLFSYVLRLFEPPFDRHDWYVQRTGSKIEQRYVIDYYMLPNKHPDDPPVPYVDARPALDHPRALLLHGRKFFEYAFPGISSYVKRALDSSR